MIDEKKLIDEIESRFKYWENKAIFYEKAGNAVDMKFCDNKAMELRDFITLIKKQPKVGEWIPVSEGVPDNSKYETYLCTLDGETIVL